MDGGGSCNTVRGAFRINMVAEQESTRKAHVSGFLLAVVARSHGAVLVTPTDEEDPQDEEQNHRRHHTGVQDAGGGVHVQRDVGMIRDLQHNSAKWR